MNWTLFLSLSFLAIVLQAIFAVFEMASVSFNRVRLQYYVSQGRKRAIWLDHLLKRPSRLFGTTLIGINTALQLGSECSRRFYEAIHLNPDFAPLTQVVLVVIFAELVPLFAAMRHPEQIVMFLVPMMIALSKVLMPLTWAFDGISKLGHWIMRKPVETRLFLSREEVKTAFSEKEKQDEITKVTSQIFKLKSMTAKDLMISLNKVPMVSSFGTVEEVKRLISSHYAPYILIHHRISHNIIGILYLRDLLRLDEKKQVQESAHSPWFVAQNASLLSILDQFRRNNQSVAIILDPSGQACGFLTLDAIIAQVFGPEMMETKSSEAFFYIERTFSGDMLLQDFNREFNTHIQGELEETLSEWIIRSLGHLPAAGEIIKMNAFQFTVEEPTLRGVKTLSVRTLQE